MPSRLLGVSATTYCQAKQHVYSYACIYHHVFTLLLLLLSVTRIKLFGQSGDEMCVRALLCLFRWNSWNHFGCGINENLIKQTGTRTAAPPPLLYPLHLHLKQLALFFLDRPLAFARSSLLRVRSRSRGAEKENTSETRGRICCMFSGRKCIIIGNAQEVESVPRDASLPFSFWVRCGRVRHITSVGASVRLSLTYVAKH